jgi:polysaccharide pyruvyl transferase WcaK-like protein
MVGSIYAGLGPAVQHRTYLIDRTWSAAEIKAAAAALDVAISGRMHFAIACLGSGTPVASFEYQDKFAGMYELFGLQELCVPGVDSLDTSAIVGLIELLHTRADIFRRAVRGRLPFVRELSARNISALRGEHAAGYE